MYFLNLYSKYISYMDIHNFLSTCVCVYVYVWERERGETRQSLMGSSHMKKKTLF